MVDLDRGQWKVLMEGNILQWKDGQSLMTTMASIQVLSFTELGKKWNRWRCFGDLFVWGYGVDGLDIVVFRVIG